MAIVSPCTILIANRGEIAARIMRTANKMGLRTAAIYTEVDREAPHVRAADVALAIGTGEGQGSYLDGAQIVAAARRVGAALVHPGYGFLAENAQFARACGDAGLLFIGPPADAIDAMGDKAQAKRRMLEAGVPCLPGYHGADQTGAAMAGEAERIGFPLMVKAAAGGGGRGMRLVRARTDLAAALASCRAEAEHAFGCGALLLEKALPDARHVEVQILADAHGHLIHLGERDCSVQRRHQKVLEEAPSPAVNQQLRARMGAVAVAAAKAVGYRNAGTVEFLLCADGAFYFLEMNTRLQVEHPVTELITCLDLVELQIRIAAGEPLPLAQEDVRFAGHAIEARLYAEAPHSGFLPQAGKLALWRPPAGAGIRVEHALDCHQSVLPHFDPLMAKVIAHAPTRDAARGKLAEALEDTVALGIETNRAFLIDCLRHPAFARGQATTGFIPAYFPAPAAPQGDPAALNIAAVLWFEASARAHGHDPARAWSSSGALAWPLELEVGAAATQHTVSVMGSGRYRVEASGTTSEIALLPVGNSGELCLLLDGRQARAHYAFADDVLYLKIGAQDLYVRETLYAQPVAAAVASLELRAPMNGKVVAVLATEGQPVEKGDRLLVVEAMKMQHAITAGCPGKIARLAVKPGEQVTKRQLLVEIAPAAAS
jgi:geranyl-CoA carboxylase alpha subunit